MAKAIVNVEAKKGVIKDLKPEGWYTWLRLRGQFSMSLKPGRSSQSPPSINPSVGGSVARAQPPVAPPSVGNNHWHH